MVSGFQAERTSEYDLQSELEFTRILLIENKSKGRTLPANRLLIIRMIESIEDFRTELNIHSFCNVSILKD